MALGLVSVFQNANAPHRVGRRQTVELRRQLVDGVHQAEGVSVNRHRSALSLYLK